MSTEYADRRVREILLKANGQSKLAEQAVHNLIARDPQFLLSLTYPYLSGIIAHAIDRARKGSASSSSSSSSAATKKQEPLPKRQATPRNTPPPRPISGGAMDGMMAALAKQFEKNSADQPPADKKARSKVSQDHLKAMQALIRHPKK